MFISYITGVTTKSTLPSKNNQTSIEGVFKVPVFIITKKCGILWYFQVSRDNVVGF